MSPDKAPIPSATPAVKQRLKLVFFVTSLESGGTERQLLLLLKHLPPSQYEKHLVCLSGFGVLEAEARLYCHALYDLAYPRVRVNGKLQWRRLPHLLLPVPKLAGVLREIRPNVFHTLIPVCNVMGAFAARIAGVRGLVASRLSLGNYRDKNNFFAKLEDLTDPAFQIIHCKSRGISTDVLTREPVRPSQIRIVYNGLDTTRFQPVTDALRLAARRALELPPDAAVIGMVANLWDYKGHLDLVRSMPSILAQAPEAVCIFIGRDAGMARQITTEAESLGIQNRIILAGEKTNVSDLLPAFNLLVSASHEEGFSNVILEAMATALPVVATNIGGNPEQVVHDQTGLLVSPHSPAELGSAIAKLLVDTETAAMWGQAGRQRVEEKFSVEAMVAGMTRIYSEISRTSGQ